MALKTIQYNNHTFNISYEILNPGAQIDMIVLHGWGSDKTLMKRSFGTFMDSFRHIYIDLPGFGGSSCAIPLKTKDYANILELFLIHLNSSKDIIMGHSFGGKVALLLKPKNLILVASAGIFITKPLKIKLKIATYKILKLFGFSKLRSIFVADDAKRLSEPMYETFKNVVDEDFSDEFSTCSAKTLLCWGRDDSATPLNSAKKIEQLIEDAKLIVYEGDHYFFMSHSKEVSKEIENIFLTTLER